MYTRESVIAEKFEALVSINILTSRMKDIYDILFLAEREKFSFITLRDAVMATFARRTTQIEDRHVLFSSEFSSSRDKEAQWRAFLQRSRLQMYLTLPEAMARIKEFLEPLCSPVTVENAIWNPNVWGWE
jgi:hypothetical protein